MANAHGGSAQAPAKVKIGPGATESGLQDLLCNHTAPVLLLPAFGGRLGWGLVQDSPKVEMHPILPGGQRRIDSRFPGNLRAPIPTFPQRGKEQSGRGYRDHTGSRVVAFLLSNRPLAEVLRAQAATVSIAPRHHPAPAPSGTLQKSAPCNVGKSRGRASEKSWRWPCACQGTDARGRAGA